MFESEPAIQADFNKRFDEKISGDDDKMLKGMTFSADFLTLVATRKCAKTFCSAALPSTSRINATTSCSR